MTTATLPSEAAPGATAFIGLGANLGDARATLGDALTALRSLALPGSFAASSLYGSAPIDSSGPDYVNAVARLRTTLAPHAVLDDERLAVPHPRAAQRGFVLEPLAELWPGGVIPGAGCVADLLAAARRDPGQRVHRLDV